MDEIDFPWSIMNGLKMKIIISLERIEPYIAHMQFFSRYPSIFIYIISMYFYVRNKSA